MVVRYRTGGKNITYIHLLAIKNNFAWNVLASKNSEKKLEHDELVNQLIALIQAKRDNMDKVRYDEKEEDAYQVQVRSRYL